MIAEFEFIYGSIVDRASVGYELKIPLAAYVALRELLPALPADLSAANAYFEHGPHVADISKVMRLVPDLRVKRLIESETGMVERLLAKVSSQLDRAAATSFNERCHVHVPGLGLLLLSEVEMLEDCCTDALQKKLDDGWRIVACCPQPDQRRPDYVIGRHRDKDAY